MQEYTPNVEGEYEVFIIAVNDTRQRNGSTESIWGYTNAQIGTDNEALKGVISRHGAQASPRTADICCNFVV